MRIEVGAAGGSRSGGRARRRAPAPKEMRLHDLGRLLADHDFGVHVGRRESLVGTGCASFVVRPPPAISETSPVERGFGAAAMGKRGRGRERVKCVGGFFGVLV